MTAALKNDYRTRPARIAAIRHALQREPLFDDEVARHHPHTRHDQQLPFMHVTGQRRQRPNPVPVPVAAARPPHPLRAAHTLLIGLSEAAAGKRPMRQLGNHVSQGVAHRVRKAFENKAVLGERHWLHASTVRSVTGSEPTSNAVEVCATVVVRARSAAETRVRAVALRLELQNDLWQCTELDGLDQ
jgi:hypothetical protein